MEIQYANPLPQATPIDKAVALNSFRTNNFDLLRIFAATQVLIGHAIRHLHLPGAPWSDILRKFSGVPMFFVMSGFLISASFEKSGSLKIYIQHRLLRILPGLWTCILITTITVICLGYLFFPGGLVWLPLQLAGVIYTPGFLASFGFHSYNGSLWTIPVELQFYFILPIVYFFKRKLYNKNAVFIFAFLFFIIAAFFILNTFKTYSLDELSGETRMAKFFRYTFLQHIYMFFLGVICYKYKLYESKTIQGKFLVWLIVFLGYAYSTPLGPIFEIIGKLILGLTAISFAYTLPALAHKLIKADISYGVYIYHGLVLNLFVEFKLIENWVYLMLVIIFSYAAGYLSWTFVEKPFLQRKKQAQGRFYAY